MRVRKAVTGRRGVAKKGSVGSRFDDFLEEEGIVDGTRARAAKRVIAWELEQNMKKKSKSK